ncbi:hypothetical protein VTI74DRAFT_5229 [Chaetomium olivicolor]
MDIPPSPPGSPPPGHDALTAKFDTFLKLKRTKGVHFNERIAASAGMRNPGVGDRLLGFVGVETEFNGGDEDAGGGNDGRGGLGQYATVLSADVWDPGCFPAWAYRGALRRAQEKVARERERGLGEAVEFVSAGKSDALGAGGGGSRSGTGTPAGSGKRKGRWDT